MTHHSEQSRIREVYERYQRAGVAKSKWSKSNVGNQCIVEERLRLLRRMLVNSGHTDLRDLNILDVGCGGGDLIASLHGFGAESNRLFGVDLIPGRVTDARKANPDVGFVAANAEYLPFPDRYFDLVSVFTVFTSILDPTMAKNVAREVARVLKSDGILIWYDFRFDSPSNRNVRGIGRNEVRSLFPNADYDIRSVTLLPPLARRLGRATKTLYPILSALPPLRSHYLAFIRKLPAL
jgi:ubiquinone/menaquinone biosynthesis C-methylase UbiE